MKNPKITAVITPEGIIVKLENWEGVSNMMIEHVHYAIIKQSQVFRAQKLGAIHAEKMREDAEKQAKAEAATGNEDDPDSKFLEEIENVLA